VVIASSTQVGSSSLDWSCWLSWLGFSSSLDNDRGAGVIIIAVIVNTGGAGVVFDGGGVVVDSGGGVILDDEDCRVVC